MFPATKTPPVLPPAIGPTGCDIASICVFGGARAGHDARLAEASARLGGILAAAGLRLVYGGGDDGLMGSIAAAAARQGGEVIAITPRFILDDMPPQRRHGQQIAVPDMHMRKRLMFDYADAFIALPGGIGTIEELSEVMTLGKLRQHAKPIVIANFGGFWDPWLGLLRHLSSAGFLCDSVRDRCRVVDDPDTVLDHLLAGSAAWTLPHRAGRAPDGSQQVAR